MLYFSDFGDSPREEDYGNISNPVQMPSYKAGLSFYTIVRHIPVKAEYNPQTDKQPKYDTSTSNSFYTGYQFTFEHYSNGQQGCSWDAGELDKSPGCDEAADMVATTNTDLRDIVNRTNGDFSSNWFIGGFGVGFVRNHEKDDAKTAGVPLFNVELIIRVAYEFAGMENPLRELYGSVAVTPQFKFRWNWSKRYKNFGHEIQSVTRFYPNRDDRKELKKVGQDLKLITWLPWTWSHGFGFYIGGRFGSSPYNLLFADNLKHQGLWGFVYKFGEQTLTSNNFKIKN